MPKHRNPAVPLVPKRRLLAAVGLMLAVTACAVDTLEPLPLDITVTADKLTAVRADSIAFEFKAQGGILRTIAIDWADGTSFTAELGGARTAQVRLRHAYQQSGVYQVSAAVDDAAAGQKTATLSVTIQ